MEFVTLEEAGVLIVEYEGPDFDLTTLGTLELQLQSIIDDITEYSLETNEVLYVVSR
jgi:hypothetical protein